MKKTLCMLITMAFLKTSTFAQTYEINSVKQMPVIDKANMKVIATSLQKLFDEAIKNPEKNSTITAVNDTVNGYYDFNGNRKYEKVESVIGNLFTTAHIQDLNKNNILLFNLIFDANGSIIVPKIIFAISTRNEDQSNGVIKKVGLLSFALEVSDSIKNELSSVKLQRLAKIDVNSLTGDLSPVKVKIPFKLYSIHHLSETTGRVVINGSNIAVTISRNYQNNETEEIFIQLLKKQTDILGYKKGEFEFAIIDDEISYDIDFNIHKGMEYRSQTINFYDSKKTIKSFTGKGKKINKI